MSFQYHSLLRLGDTDHNHLRYATTLGRAVCTYDADFLALAASGMEHAGIIYAHQQKASIGGWIREIRLLNTRFSAEDLKNQIVFLSMR